MNDEQLTGIIVKAVREAKNITVEGLAESCGVTFNRIYALENGKRAGFNIMVAVAKALDCPIEVFTGDQYLDDDIAAQVKAGIDAQIAGKEAEIENLRKLRRTLISAPMRLNGNS